MRWLKLGDDLPKLQDGCEMQRSEMKSKMAKGNGFIAALDQSGGSTPHALEEYGLDQSSWHTEDEMFRLIHEMRSRIVTSPVFGSGKVLGAILFERTMDGEIGGDPAPLALIERGIVPFIKIDQGLQEAEDGVQLMKPLTALNDLLPRARALGVFGTKARSVIHHADSRGIGAIVAQQFEVAERVLSYGMMPILEPEVEVQSSDSAEAEAMLVQELLGALDALPDEQNVMLKLSIPAVSGLFDPLVNHPKVLRVVALSGGYSRQEACAKLSENRGIIASFSRALLHDLRFNMPAGEFNAALKTAIDEIFEASTHKHSART